jgi:hypothetical protein
MRTEAETDRVHELALALLKRRGIAAEAANYEQVADAYEIAAEAVEHGRETVPEMLAGAAVGSDTPDERTTGVLAKFALDGRFVADLSLDERDLLEAAIAAEAGNSDTDDDDGAKPPTVSGPGGAYCTRCDFLRSSGLCTC